MENEELTTIPREGEILSEESEDEKVKGATSESSPETASTEAAPTPAGANEQVKENELPFHKHPRWKEMYDRNKRLEEELLSVKSSIEQSQKTTSEIPEWFKEIYGDNPDIWKKYQAHEDRRYAEVLERVKEEQRQESERAKSEEKRWQSWVDEQIESLKDDGLEFDKNELMKVAVDFRPTDDEGNISLKKAYDIMQGMKREDGSVKASAKKKVAAATGSSQKGEPSSETVVTSNDMRGKSWSSLIK